MKTTAVISTDNNGTDGKRRTVEGTQTGSDGVTEKKERKKKKRKKEQQKTSDAVGAETRGWRRRGGREMGEGGEGVCVCGGGGGL